MYGLRVDGTSDDPEDIHVITVHGLGGKENDTWEPLSGSVWGYVEWLSQRTQISMYSYPLVDEEANIFTREGLRCEALRLLKAIEALNRPKWSRIIFVGHDIGGTLIKEALIQAAFGDAKFRNIYWSTWALLFIGCPHGLNYSPSLDSSMTRLFALHETLQTRSTKAMAVSVSRAIAQVNQDFADTKVQKFALVFNTSSNVERLDDRVFDTSETALGLGWEIPLHQENSPLSHKEMAQEMPSKMRDIIESLMQKPYEKPSLRMTLLSSENRFSPDGISADKRDITNKTEKFKLGDWASGYGSSFLLIHNTPGAVSSNALLWKLSRSVELFAERQEYLSVHYFDFKKGNQLYHDVQSMVFTLISEMYHEFVNIVGKSTELFRIGEISGLGLEDQFIILKDILSAERSSGMVCILVNFGEHVPRYQWLLDKFAIIASDTDIRLKVLFVNESDLPGPSSEKIDIQTMDPSMNGSVESVIRGEKGDNEGEGLLNLDNMELIIGIPHLQQVLPRLRRLKVPSSDLELRQMLLQWLSFSDTNTILSVLDQGVLESSLSEAKVFKSVSMSAADRIKKDSLAEILRLITLSFRPLTTHELLDLATASRLWNRDRNRRSFRVDDIPSFLPGILTVHQNEVCFAHHHLRDFILSDSQSNFGVNFGDGQQDWHRQIAELCLRYLLSSHKLLDRYSYGEWEDIAGPESRLDFLVYAIRYWPAHARSAGEAFTVQSPYLQSLLKDSQLLLRWSKAYSIFSPRFMQHDLQRAGPFAAFAENGLETILVEAMEYHASAPWYKEGCSYALIAAAASEHIGIVRLLVEQMTYDSHILQKSLLAALSSPNEAAVELLLIKALGIAQSFNDLSELFERAGSLGYYEIVQRLCIRWTLSDCGRRRGGALLQAASVGESLDRLKDVFDRESDSIEEHDIVECLRLSLRHGQVDVSEYLMEKCLLLGLHSNGLSEPENTEDESLQGGQQKYLLSIQDTLATVIKAGQHGSLRKLLAVLERHGIEPQWPHFLFRCAIDYRRNICFDYLFDIYAQNTNLQTVRTMVLEDGNSAMLGKLLTADNVFDEDDFPLCLKAIMDRGGNALDMLRILIEEGKKRLNKEAYREAITHHLRDAVSNNKPELADVLIKAGADIERRTIGGDTRTPLFHAAYRGYEEITASLINAKADVRIITDDEDKWSPIHAAADNLNILRMLLNSGADVDARTAHGSTALMLAIQWNKETCVDELLKYQPDLYCRRDNESLLSVASGGENPKLATRLLDAGMDPCDPKVMAINLLQLHKCVESNNAELLQRLLLYNFPIDYEDEDGRTPLNCIQDQTDVAILRLLVYRGALVNTIDKAKETPLSKMIRADDVQRAEFLMSRGANTNARIGGFSGTPLHLACSMSKLDMIKMLIDKGADVDDIQDGNKGTIFQAACERTDNEEKTAVLEYLLNTVKVDVEQSSKRWGNNLNKACLMADMKTIELLVHRGIDVNGEDRIGRRPIHFALYRTLDHVRYLCEKGADLLAKDMMQRSALHFAVVSGHLDLVKYILKEEPTLVNVMDCDGWTPLFWAIRDCRRWGTETSQRGAIIRELKSHGASIMIQAEGVERRWTPYELARYYDLDEETVNLLKPTKRNLKKRQDAAFWHHIFDAPVEEFKKGKADNGGYCDVCLMAEVGVYYICKECEDFLLCFKCYRSRNTLHPKHDFFTYNEDEDDGTSEKGESDRHSRTPDRSQSFHSESDVEEEISEVEVEEVGDTDMETAEDEHIEENWNSEHERESERSEGESTGNAMEE